VTPDSAQGLFWISVGAFLIPILSRKMRIPSSIGEIIYGMIIGEHLLHVFHESEFIELMAHLGFAILMFSAGLEIDFAPLRKRGSKTLQIAWNWVLMCAGCAVIFAYFLGVSPWATLAVCSVSIGLASVVLKEKDLIQAPIGQVILAIGLIGETASILLMTVFDFEKQYGLSSELFFAMFKFIGIFLLAYIFMRIFRFMIWWAPHKMGRFLETGDPLELGVRLSVALLFIFIATSTYLGVEPILGAFIAGTLFGYIFQEREVINDKINAMGQGFFVPFFFIVVGSHFDPRSFLDFSKSGIIGILILLAVMAKLIPSAFFTRAGMNIKEIIAGGLLLAAPLTLTVAVAEIGHTVGAIDTNLRECIIMTAIIMGLAGPLISKALLAEKAPPSEDCKKENA
jgi:Kef-type K+ transport system membrane component KefB